MFMLNQKQDRLVNLDSVTDFVLVGNTIYVKPGSRTLAEYETEEKAREAFIALADVLKSKAKEVDGCS